MLHIIYRSYGGENFKGRPDYYSKLHALASVIRAFKEIPFGSAEIIFLNDGPIPEDRLRLMRSAGVILNYEKLGLRGSMRAALNLPADRGWDSTDVVWLAEDDYFYLPESMTGLLAAASVFKEADYFGLYAQIGTRQPNSSLPGDARVPVSWQGKEPVLVAGHPWRKALSTTSTFGARVGALREDSRMMKIAMLTGGAWDHSTCLIYQGFLPYPLKAMFQPFGDVSSVKGFFRQLGGLGARLGLNVYATWLNIKRSHGRILVAPDPALSTHLETAFLASGHDWRTAAGELEQWLAQHAEPILIPAETTASSRV